MCQIMQINVADYTYYTPLRLGSSTAAKILKCLFVNDEGESRPRATLDEIWCQAAEEASHTTLSPDTDDAIQSTLIFIDALYSPLHQPALYHLVRISTVEAMKS